MGSQNNVSESFPCGERRFLFKTLEDSLRQGKDNFLLLRFLAAALVIYGHAPAITGGDGPLDLFVWLNWGWYSGSIAVDLFFVISGFLITGSFLRQRHVVRFLWARLLRIVPAYAVCLVLCAFVLGPLFSAMGLWQYFSESAPYQYVWNNLQLRQGHLLWEIPGVFTDNPKRMTINGSIWTLPAEVKMYFGVAVLGFVGILSKRRLFNLFFTGLLIYGVMYAGDLVFLSAPAYERLAGLFLIGAFCYVNRAWFPNHGAILLVMCGGAWLCRETWAYPCLFACCEALFVFWFAYNTRWYGFNRFSDYSYGIYLWGFPMQQAVAAVSSDLSFLSNTLIGFLLALMLAVASWHFVEKPALKGKVFFRKSHKVVPATSANG